MVASPDTMTYGNTALPEGTPDRPLVTFALFAYNQETYIREAVEGAFSQTYEPLEIILSDDCSSDGTFEIMKEMAEAYRGPHLVKLRKSEVNSGILNHVLGSVSSAKGKLILLAAGDDISYSERTKITVKEWIECKAWGLFGNCDIIENEDKIIEFNNCPKPNVEILKWLHRLGTQNFVHGATSAYDVRLFSCLKKSVVPIFSEDTVFTTLIHIFGKDIMHIPLPLIKYRRHAAALSNGLTSARGFKEIMKTEVKLSNYAKSVPPMCEYIVRAAELTVDGRNRLSTIREEIESTREHYEARAFWAEMNFFHRIRIFLSTSEMRSRSFLFPRIAGLRVFALLKSAFQNLYWTRG